MTKAGGGALPHARASAAAHMQAHVAQLQARARVRARTRCRAYEPGLVLSWAGYRECERRRYYQHPGIAVYCLVMRIKRPCLHCTS